MSTVFFLFKKVAYFFFSENFTFFMQSKNCAIFCLYAFSLPSIRIVAKLLLQLFIFYLKKKKRNQKLKVLFVYKFFQLYPTFFFNYEGSHSSIKSARC